LRHEIWYSTVFGSVADGMTDELTTQLAKIRALRVTSRTSTMRYKNTEKPLVEIASELHVDAVVEGSVVRSGNRVRITAQLVDGRSDAHVWAEKYEDDLRDILALQSDVAEKIARNIGVTLSTSERLRLKAGAPVDPVAHETYLKGIFYWNRLNCDDFEKALSFFQQSADRDPNFAPAYSGMADSYFNLADWACRPQEETYPKAQAAALKAAALDPTLADPHTALGELAFYHEWNWTKADSEFRRALDLGPSDAGNHTSYAIYLISTGKQQEALEQWRIARALDPVSEITGMLGSYLYYLAHEYDQAIDQGRKTLELYPRSGSAHYWMGQAYEQKGMYADAVDNYLAPESGPGPKLEYQRLARKAFDEKGIRGYWMSEFHKKFEGNLASPCWETLIYAHLEDKEKTLRHLEDGFEHHCDGLQFLKVEPIYDFIRQEPRYSALLQLLGL
jgi:TolB-like protein